MTTRHGLNVTFGGFGQMDRDGPNTTFSPSLLTNIMFLSVLILRRTDVQTFASGQQASSHSW